ncbi:MAG: M3 family metallopeptidase [Candidatus Binatia bacterium]
MNTTGLKAEGIQWNLAELYDGPDDPRIEADLVEARRRAETFAQKYRGKVASGELNGSALANVLAEYEALAELEHRPSFYASLLFASDTQNTKAQRLVQRAREVSTEIGNLLVFFSLELIGLDDQQAAALLTAPEMAEYRHYLEALRRFKPHTLSEREEQLLNQKHLTSNSAFEQLYEELTGSFRFKLTVEGEEKEMTDGEVMALLRHPNRELRERAFTTFLDTHANHSLVLTSIFNNIFLDHKIDCEMRQYQDVTLPTHLSNEIAPETVEAMMQTVERHYPLAQEYFRLKAQMLNVERLKNTDIYAPIEAEIEQFTFSQAQELILTAFGQFNEPFAALAADFFQKRWIDAEVRPGKRGGAFCAALSPLHHPYVLCSFNGTGRDL